MSDRPAAAKQMNLLTENPVYKPFRYPWAHEAWLTQQRVHWLPEEVPLADDVKDWHKNLDESERNLLTQIFRFFMQADVEVNNCYRQGTEILTGRGWVDFRSLHPDDLVAQVLQDGCAEFVRPSHVHTYPAPDNLIRFHSDRGFDLTVTPDHDMVVSDGVGYSKVRASAYPKRQDVYQPMTAPLVREGCGLTSRECLLIAHQADPEGMVGKGFEWVDLTQIGARWCREFINELSYWDVWTSDNGLIHYRSTNEDAADKVQAIATLAGFRAAKIPVDYDLQSSVHFLVSISPGLTKAATNQIKRDVVIPEPGENVHCVTVPSGMVVVRNEGRVVVSGNCYMKNYSQVFKPTEILMMLSAFSNSETIHIAAYSHLLDTIGMPEIEYTAFMKYKEMKDKFDYMQSFSVADKHEIAKTLAAFGAFTEGLQLFASFAILMNFPRHNKMKGMGQIVSWSVRDETLHCLSVIRLFRTFVQENPEIWTDTLRSEIVECCSTIVSHEDAFIDLAFEMGDVVGMKADEVKRYIRYIADRRLTQLGLPQLYHIETNPLPWLDDMLNAVEHANFFENRSTEYSRASTNGTWEEAFSLNTFGNIT